MAWPKKKKGTTRRKTIWGCMKTNHIAKEKEYHTENSTILESTVTKMESKRHGFYEKGILKRKQANIQSEQLRCQLIRKGSWLRK